MFACLELRSAHRRIFFLLLRIFLGANSSEKEEEEKKIETSKNVVMDKILANQTLEKKFFFLVLFLRSQLTTPIDHDTKTIHQVINSMKNTILSEIH